MQTTTHTPRPAHVSKKAEYRFQRRYGADEHSSFGLRPVTDLGYHPTVTVYRDGTTNTAELQVTLGLGTSASVDVLLTPPELRELAACLLDAAHDIESLPAVVLAKEAA